VKSVLLLGVALALSARAETNMVEKSVVKLFSTMRYPDAYAPWTKRSPTEVSGSGVVIPGHRILSNAHLVVYASQIQIQANQSGDKLGATVVAVAPGIDLAVLKLDDESFFDAHPPVELSSALPDIKDAVMVYGYPEGGATLSITKGIVSREEFSRYSASVFGLRIQVDAAINPGNSGGPVLVGDKMAGLTYSVLPSAQSIGYVIPAEEIDLFLKDIADGHYDGKPAMRDVFQTLENPALRSYLQAPKEISGVVVYRPDSTNADYPLKTWDIITNIGDQSIDDQGMVAVNGTLRLSFLYFVQKLESHGTVPLTIFRSGHELKIDLPVSSSDPKLIPSLQGEYPSYFIYGPLVFSAATRQFVDGLLEDTNGMRYTMWLSSEGSSLLSRSWDKPAFDGEGLVVITSPFFPHALSRGYANPLAQVIKSVNGIRIKNLAHLVEVLRDSKEQYTTIEFEDRFGERLVFPRKEIMTATDSILSDNGIRSQGSADMMAVWKSGK
jgi:S1-C subfamily serine protease